MRTEWQVALAEARRQHPGIEVRDEDYELAWTSRDCDVSRAGDVLLATAIARGQPAALAWLVTEVRSIVRREGARLGANQSFDEVESRVVERIAVSTPERPARVNEYAASGPLGAWVRVFVARALAEAKGQRESLPLEELVVASVSSSPEVKALRADLTALCQEVLRVALEALEERPRALLSLHYLEGVGLSELGRMYQVHPVTISRWLLSARDEVIDRFRDEVTRRTGVARLDVDSLVRAVRSHLELRWERIGSSVDGSG